MIKTLKYILVPLLGLLIFHACQESIVDTDAPFVIISQTQSQDFCPIEQVIVDIRDNYKISRVEFFINDINYTDSMSLSYDYYNEFHNPQNYDYWMIPPLDCPSYYPCLNLNEANECPEYYYYPSQSLNGVHSRQYNCSFIYRTFENGNYELKCIAYDDSENAGTDIFNFELNKSDGIPPTVEIMIPPIESDSCLIINGIDITAEDNSGICNIEYYINDILVFREYEPPFSLSLSYFRCSTFIFADSLIKVQAVAMDSLHNKTTSNILNLEYNYFIQCTEEYCYNEVTACEENLSICYEGCQPDGGLLTNCLTSCCDHYLWAEVDCVDSIEAWEAGNNEIAYVGECFESCHQSYQILDECTNYCDESFETCKENTAQFLGFDIDECIQSFSGE